MRKIRTIVVDDEPFARARILKLLAQVDFVSVIGECKNGSEALKAITNYKPDLIFLDIQMPDLNGFEVLSKKEFSPNPFVIFVTAYDQYALKAFDVHAVDYLLKPYDDERFMQALDHARQQILLKDNSKIHQKMLKLLEQYKHEQTEALTALEIKERGRTNLLNINDIYWIEADGNYLKIYTEKKAHLIRQTLQTIEEQLDERMFLRIHRSILVHTIYIDRIKYKGNNQYVFTIKNGEKILSSRSYKEQIISFLEDQEIEKN